MTAYLIRRLWQMVPTLIGVVLLVFVLFKQFGGDPAEILGGLTNREILRKVWGGQVSARHAGFFSASGPSCDQNVLVSA